MQAWTARPQFGVDSKGVPVAVINSGYGSCLLRHLRNERWSTRVDPCMFPYSLMRSEAIDYVLRPVTRRILVVFGRSSSEPGLAAAVGELGAVTAIDTNPDSAAARLELPEGPWDLVFLSLHVSSETVFPWVSQVRRSIGRAPIAVVVANASAEQVVALLDAGADDVLASPATESLLRARAHALLRCTSGMYPASAAAAQLPQASPDISLKGQDLRVHGLTIQLTATEAALVATLLEQRRQWRTAAELLERTFDSPASGDTSLVRVHIFNIRRKLGGLAYCVQGRRRYGYRIL